MFPNSRDGLGRALTWITRKVDGQSALVVIKGVGSYGAGLANRLAFAGLLVAETVGDAGSRTSRCRQVDALDAVRIARSVLAVDTSRLRWPRATDHRVVLCGLTVAREEMVAEPTGAINALTALLHTIELGIDARKALSHSQAPKNAATAADTSSVPAAIKPVVAAAAVSADSTRTPRLASSPIAALINAGAATANVTISPSKLDQHQPACGASTAYSGCAPRTSMHSSAY